VSDPIHESLLKIIADKKKAEKPSKTKTWKSTKDDGEERSNVVNIMDALKKSVRRS
jgi:DNA end-binding protein Ku